MELPEVEPGTVRHPFQAKKVEKAAFEVEARGKPVK